MRIERIKNASRNIVFGILLRCYQIIVPFIMRTAMLYVMGVQYLGLNSLFTSLIQVLNLAELGVGSAMVFSMYRPIAEDDHDKICALLRLYRTYYRIIGMVILMAGLMAIPFLHLLVKSDLPPDINLTSLYLMNLVSTVMTYWMYAYRSSILQAHQRIDLISKVSLITSSAQYVLQLAVIVLLHNYYIYLLVALSTQLITNVLTAFVAYKAFPMYKPKGKLPKENVKEINKKIRDLFTSKLGFVIVNSADTIVISSFLGLTVLAIYQNYFFIVSAVISFIAIILGACTAGVGNSLVVETKSKNFNDLNKLTFIICWITGVCFCFFLCLFQPFMREWAGEAFLMEYGAVICLCIYFFVYELNQLWTMYKDAAGIWHKDKFRPLITALSNLAMNLLMVNSWGLYGVILSTVLSTVCIGMPWLLHNLFTLVFERDQLQPYLKKLVNYIGVIIIAIIATCSISCFIPSCGLLEIAIKFLICCIAPNVIFFLCYYKKQEFTDTIALADKISDGKLQKISRIICKDEQM